jgi:hypothetical protein
MWDPDDDPAFDIECNSHQHFPLCGRFATTKFRGANLGRSEWAQTRAPRMALSREERQLDRWVPRAFSLDKQAPRKGSGSSIEHLPYTGFKTVATES